MLHTYVQDLAVMTRSSCSSWRVIWKQLTRSIMVGVKRKTAAYIGVMQQAPVPIVGNQEWPKWIPPSCLLPLAHKRRMNWYRSSPFDLIFGARRELSIVSPSGALSLGPGLEHKLTIWFLEYWQKAAWIQWCVSSPPRHSQKVLYDIGGGASVAICAWHSAVIESNTSQEFW